MWSSKWAGSEQEGDGVSAGVIQSFFNSQLIQFWHFGNVHLVDTISSTPCELGINNEHRDWQWTIANIVKLPKVT